MKQASLFPKAALSTPRAYGHGLEKGKRKTKRPFSPKLPLHVVMRASKAKGEHSLLRARNKHWVEHLIRKYATLYRIRIYRIQNVGNHLHILLQTRTQVESLARRELSTFLRRFSGELAMKVGGGKKGSAFGRFWDDLVYSRIVTWGREFKALEHYFIKNLFEAHGLWIRKRNPDWELITIEACQV